MATNSSSGISSDDIKQVFEASDSLEPKAVLIQVIVMTGLSVLMILTFTMLRPTNKTVYEPKMTYHAPNKLPPRISPSFFGWIPPLFRNHERHLFPVLGLDAIAFLRFLRLMRWLFTAIAIVSCGVLGPLDVLYTIANNPPEHDVLSSLTIRDIQGVTLYAHVGCLYFITFLLVALILHHWRAIYHLRQQWYHSPEYQHAFYSRALIVTNIQPKYRSEDGLWRIFDGMNLPYQVTSVHIGKDVGGLPELVKEHNKNVQEFEKILTKHCKKDPHCQERPTIKTGGFWGCGGSRQDAVRVLSHKLRQSAAAAEQYRSQMVRNEPANYGFVSMASIPAAHGAAFDLRNEHPKGLSFELAPNPKDILWENLALSKGERRFRTVTGFVILVLLCTASLIPLFPIASIANLDVLAASHAIPFLHSWAQASPSSYALASGIIPPALAALFNLLLPRMMRWLSKYMGVTTFSGLESVVIARYFTFMIISQLVIFTIFGVVLNSVLEIIDAANLQTPTMDLVFDNLNKLPSRITRTYVDQSSFWLKWFALSGFSTVFGLVQVANLLLVSIKDRFSGRTPREIREWTKPPVFDYAITYSNFLFMSTVGLLFSPLAPLVPLASAIVFWVASWVFKYQMTYVFVTKVESGGRSWNTVINRVLFAAAFMQIIAILTIGLQHQFQSMQFLASIPSLLITLLFKHYLNKRFADDFQYFLPQFEELSRAIVHSEESDILGRKLEARYSHPALQVQTELQMPLVFPESVPLLRRNSGRGRYGRDVSRAAGEKSTHTTVGQEILLEGVSVTPVKEDEIACDPLQYSRDREAECDRDSVHSIVSSQDSAPWRRSAALADSSFSFQPGYEFPSQKGPTFSYTKPSTQHDSYTHAPSKAGVSKHTRQSGEGPQQHRSKPETLISYRTGKILPDFPDTPNAHAQPSDRRHRRRHEPENPAPSSSLSSSTSPSYRTAPDELDQATPPAPHSTIYSASKNSPMVPSRSVPEPYHVHIQSPSDASESSAQAFRAERPQPSLSTFSTSLNPQSQRRTHQRDVANEDRRVHRSVPRTESQPDPHRQQTGGAIETRQSRTVTTRSADHPNRRTSARPSKWISGQPFALQPDAA